MCLLLHHAVHVRATCLKAMRRMAAQEAPCGGGRAVPSQDSPTRMRDDGMVPCLEFCFPVRWCPGHTQLRGRSGRCCALVGMSLVKACSKEPLLSEGLQKLFLCGLAQLCFRSQVGVSGWTVAVLLLAGGGICKFKVYGSRSRNDLGAVIYASLAAVALIFLSDAWAQSVLGRALRMAAIAVPVLFFLHFQLMPGDIVLQANGIMEQLHKVKDTDVAEKLPLTLVAWGFEAKWHGVKDVLAWYRRHASWAIRLQTSVQASAEAAAQSVFQDEPTESPSA